MPDVMNELSKSQQPLAAELPMEEPRRSPVKFIVLGMLFLVIIPLMFLIRKVPPVRGPMMVE